MRAKAANPGRALVDAGPGKYFTFPAFYFQHRTYGLIVRDKCPR